MPTAPNKWCNAVNIAAGSCSTPPWWAARVSMCNGRIDADVASRVSMTLSYPRRVVVTCIKCSSSGSSETAVAALSSSSSSTTSGSSPFCSTGRAAGTIRFSSSSSGATTIFAFLL
mmetsp:Transcript_37441/g.91756  ORF Transcript_37441/g.91756 Transcript_37441/m.91756 type:complete len:116 (+) Transcript_37441:180-527(+)